MKKIVGNLKDFYQHKNWQRKKMLDVFFKGFTYLQKYFPELFQFT